MADYRLSAEADRDLLEIASYTLETWNEAQVDRYMGGLHDAPLRLARNPRLGTPMDDIRSGYYRRRHRSHMIFYKLATDGILVVRVLHGSMDYTRHL
jgi:toxin ParE1/3/4